MLPFRHAAIREELMRFKNKRDKLMIILRYIDESEHTIERILGDKYIGFFERYPDLAEAFYELAEKD